MLMERETALPLFACRQSLPEAFIERTHRRAREKLLKRGRRCDKTVSHVRVPGPGGQHYPAGLRLRCALHSTHVAHLSEDM